MIVSRPKPAATAKPAATFQRDPKKLPELADLLEARDYTGAVALLKFLSQAGQGDDKAQLWLAYCYFHMGEYEQAMEEYSELILKSPERTELYTYVACCQFFRGCYKESLDIATKGGDPKSPLQNRLLFHASHKLNDERRLMTHHQQLQDVIEDQLCLASIHYLRQHYQEAIDIYKRLLLSNRAFVALNVYLALCYYKLDYNDVSLEVLQIYLQLYPDSVVALNLKACNHYKLFNGKAAEAELKRLVDMSSTSFSFAKDIVKHNQVVFRNGDGALQHLPPLVDLIPEARLNLVIYHLKRDNVQEAFDFMKDLEPASPNEYILKGIVHCLLAQQQLSKDHLKVAQQYFQLVGESASEKDTIPGRQCMASCLFLLKQFEEALIYLNSIKSYFYSDDSFNYNLGQVQAALGAFKDAEESLLLVQSDKMKSEYTYQSTLARCCIMNKKAKAAWDMYLKMDTSAESFTLLQVIANDCYKMGQFYYSAKAFDVLERLDTNPEYWEGKRGACVGVFQLVLANREPAESLRDVIQLLQKSTHPQVEGVLRVMRKWARDNRLPV